MITDRELADELAETLKPLARAFINLPGEKQVALTGLASVSIHHLRDAYLALAHWERTRQREDNVNETL